MWAGITPLLFPVSSIARRYKSGYGINNEFLYFYSALHTHGIAAVLQAKGVIGKSY